MNKINERAIELLRVHALEALRKMTDPNGPKVETLPIAVTRDEGGYTMHEIIDPLNVEVSDWRFHSENDFVNADWTPKTIEDSDWGKRAYSVCRIPC